MRAAKLVVIGWVALSFGSPWALASDKSVLIETIPAGARVEMNGNIMCTTPCSIEVPGSYFGRKHSAVSPRGNEPIRVKLTKEGYAPKSVDLTTGPIHWSSLTGAISYDYYIIKSERFTFQLDAAGAPDVASSAQLKGTSPPSSSAIVLASPSGVRPNETVEFNESPLVVRGVATDNAGILLVTVNGSIANMRPQNPQATEFWSEPLPISAGNTPIEIIASNSAHVETKLAFTVHYAPKAESSHLRALTMEEILSLLKGDVPSARIEDLVKERGINFALTAAELDEIRKVGGSEGLIRALRQTAPPK
jgi:hypothetical protein